MTFSALNQHAPFPEGRVLLLSEWSEALSLAQLEPVDYILAITHLERGIFHGIEAGDVLAFPANGPIEAVCWMGANLIPIIPNYKEDAELTKSALAAFASIAATSRRRSSSIVGPRSLVLLLWDFLEPNWRAPREIRPSQPSMIIDRPPKVEPDQHVRVARWNDFDLILPASVHMFIEEVGVSPLTFGSAQYSMRVKELIADQRTLMRLSSTLHHSVVSSSDTGSVALDVLDTDLNKERRSLPARDTVAFKADFGAVIPQVAQIQGVWVNPQYRGRGLSAPAMASVVQYGLNSLAPIISLYVNDYNSRAIATYRKVGFEQVGEYATILF